MLCYRCQAFVTQRGRHYYCKACDTLFYAATKSVLEYTPYFVYAGE